MTLKPIHDTNPDYQATVNLQTAWELELPGVMKPSGPADRFYSEERERLIFENLHQFFPNRSVKELNVLDLGCVKGDILPLLLSHGCRPENLHACGLIKSTLEWLKTNYPELHTESIRPNPLPFESEQFDIIFLFSMFGLMFDGNTRQHVALEVERMLKPGGYIFSLAFTIFQG
jgi:SAM-dependent methyltransferase